MTRFLFPGLLAAAMLAAPLPALAQSADAQLVSDICLAEARARAVDVGATEVSLDQVRRLEAGPGGTGRLDATVTLETRAGSGQVRSARRQLSCQTRDGQVTAFRMD
jgi:hypothetical protein